MSVPDWVTISLGVVSPIVSLGGSYISWRIYQNQRGDSKIVAHKTMQSLVPSFVADVRTAKASLQVVMDMCAQIPRVSMSNSQQSIFVVRSLAAIRMPAVEKFKDEIVRFDPVVADPLLQALSCLDRVRHLVDGFFSQGQNAASLNDAIAGVRKSVPEAIKLFEIAESVLAMPSGASAAHGLNS
jgi:hypothetical protein